MYDLSTTTATDVKQVLPILYFCGTFASALSIFHFLCSQYDIGNILLINYKTTFSVPWDTCVSQLSFKVCYHFFP